MKYMHISFEAKEREVANEDEFLKALRQEIADVAASTRTEIMKIDEIHVPEMQTNQPVKGFLPLANTRVAKGSVRPDTSDEF